MPYSVIDCDTGDKHEGCASIEDAHYLALIHRIKDYEIWDDKGLFVDYRMKPLQ